MNNLQQRVVSAAILALIVLAVAWAGGFAFGLLVTLVALVVFLEWLGMIRRDLHTVQLTVVAAFILAILVLLFGFGIWTSLIVALAMGMAAALMAESLGAGRQVATGFAYAFLPALALIALRDGPAGLTVILFLFAVVWATDIGAYFVGRALGGPKLAPSISPGKTWSGAIGGLVIGLGAGLLLALLTGTATAATPATAILLSVAAQLGDLYESSVKRAANVKDSSQLIPGHGGVMDRIDGLIFAAVVLYLLQIVGIHAVHPALSSII